MEIDEDEDDDNGEGITAAAGGATTRKRARTASSSSSSSSSSSRPVAAPKASQQQMFRFMESHAALKTTLTQEMKSVFTLLTSSNWMDEALKKDLERETTFAAIREQFNLVGLLELVKTLAQKGSTDSQDTIALNAILTYCQQPGKSSQDYANEHTSLVSSAKLAGVDPTIPIVKNQITNHLKNNVNAQSQTIIRDYLVKCAMEGTAEPDYEGFLKKLVAVERAIASTKSSSSSSASSSNPAFVAENDSKTDPKNKRKRVNDTDSKDSGAGRGQGGRGRGQGRGHGGEGRGQGRGRGGGGRGSRPPSPVPAVIVLQVPAHQNNADFQSAATRLNAAAREEFYRPNTQGPNVPKVAKNPYQSRSQWPQASKSKKTAQRRLPCLQQSDRSFPVMEKKFCRLKVDDEGILSEDAISIQLSTTKIKELRLIDGDIVVLKAIRKTKTMCVVYKNDTIISDDHVRINKAILSILRIHVGDTVVLTIPTQNDTTHLIDAASRGLLPIVQYLVQKPGTNVNERAPNGISPLCAASLEGNYDVMEFLVRSGSTKDYTMSTLKWLPIHWVAVSGDISAMNQLLQQDPKAVDTIADDGWIGPNAYDGWTRPNTFQGPITSGQGSIGGGRTALHFASANNHVEMVKLLLESKADANHGDCIGWTPLYRAAAKGHLSVVECLVQHPFTLINLANHMGFYPLVTAAAGGHIEVVKYLTENNSYLKTPTKNGWYPINLAITYGFLTW